MDDLRDQSEKSLSSDAAGIEFLALAWCHPRTYLSMSEAHYFESAPIAVYAPMVDAVA